ncbi:MAG: tetratricopeptide repeat protein [Phycisphaerales bacterium]|nr:tetratricopeptide repeat protein [Phycisphaerales bacterium]
MSSKIVLSLIAILTASSFAGCTSNVERYRKQGIALYQQDQYDQSLETLNKALSYDQFDAQSNTYAGLIHYRAGHYVQATYHFKVALQSDPSSEEAKDGLTATLIQRGQPDLALDYLERAAKLAEQVDDPRWKKSYTNRPYQNQIEEALYVGKAGDRLRIARTYEKLGDYDNAAVYYDKALQIAPRNARILLARATMYEKIGNKSECRESLIRAYNADPATPGLIEAMTRNNVAISSVIGTPLK